MLGFLQGPSAENCMCTFPCCKLGYVHLHRAKNKEKALCSKSSLFIGKQAMPLKSKFEKKQDKKRERSEIFRVRCRFWVASTRRRCLPILPMLKKYLKMYKYCSCKNVSSIITGKITKKVSRSLDNQLCRTYYARSIQKQIHTA